MSQFIPNEQQKAVIDASRYDDVIISAGAGSGKTATLSNKVLEMIRRGEFNPDEILVLTFTNNAAHEMKERIIQIFKDDPDLKDKADLIHSSHIQTFDSFCQFLVKKYASALNISSSFTIANETDIESKILSLIDEEMDKCYFDNRYQSTVETLKRFDILDDNKTRGIIKYLYDELHKMLYSDMIDFMDNYEKRYLSSNFYDQYRTKAVQEYKDNIILNVKLAYFISQYSDVIMPKKGEIDIDELEGLFKSNNKFDISLDEIEFEDKEYSQLTIDYVKLILDKQGEDFLESIRKFLKDNEELFSKEFKAQGIKNKIKKILITAIRPTSSLSRTKEEDYKRFLSFKEPIMFFFNIIKRVDLKMDDYKKIHSTYTFDDIAEMALSLLDDSIHPEVADEIRRQFKYIMVDEYQDTSDLQERFIVSLCKENSQKECAHCFTVGDAKQSIYGFRNAKVELFNQRIERLSDGKVGHKVFPMNKNYRSAYEVLDDINAIFDKYMTIDHGFIDYSDPSGIQRLVYGPGKKETDIRREDKGIYRILIDTELKKTKENTEAECLAIIEDIRDKMEKKMLVTGKESRKYRYSDFCILTRKKSDFALYQSLFDRYSIPLNTIVASDLKVIDSIQLIQSLVKLLAHFTCDMEVDIPHLFASIARSYAFSYEDQYIFDKIANIKDEDYSSLYDDPIFVKLFDFIDQHNDKSIKTIFIDLLDTFDITRKLYLIGNVSDNISKIESLYSMISSLSLSACSLKDFVKLFDTIKKKDIKLDSNQTFTSDDAVSLMTIHASKGLERNVVYMPVSSNKLSKGNNSTKVNCILSCEYGLLFEDYYFPIEEIDESPLYNSVYDIYNKNKGKRDLERDEHVRLFYVALTRAKESIYIVGNNNKTEDQNRNNETLYGMLSYLPHVNLIDNRILDHLLKVNPANKTIIDRYQDIQKKILINNKRDDSTFANGSYKLYEKVYDEYYKKDMDALYIKSMADVFSRVYHLFRDEFIKDQDDYDFLAKLYSRDENIDSLDKLITLLNKNKKEVSEEVADGEDEEDQVDLDQQEVKKILDSFKDDIINEKDGNSDVYNCAGYLFSIYYLKVKHPVFTSYRSENYQDNYYYSPIKTDMILEEDSKITKLTDIKADDTDITFIVKERDRASHESDGNETQVDYQNMAFGTRLHKILELVSFTSRDLSFVKDERERKLIQKVLQLDIFNGISEDDVKKEFTYFDDELDTYSSIDLLIKKNDRYIIVDYKTKDISDEEYDLQLKTYKRNVVKLFKAKEDDVKMILLSLVDGITREVK